MVAHVIVNDVKEGSAKETVQYIADLHVAGTATIHICDVSDRDAVVAMMKGVQKKYGHVDIVVANAYYSYRAPFLEADWSETLRTFQVTQVIASSNPSSCALCTQTRALLLLYLLATFCTNAILHINSCCVSHNSFL